MERKYLARQYENEIKDYERKQLFEFTKISDECIKCGKCIPTCTVHQVNPDEVTSPRGFIELLGSYQRGELELDKSVKDIFESCFLCTNCVDICPNSLPTDMVIEEVRADIAKKYGIAWYKRAFFGFFAIDGQWIWQVNWDLYLKAAQSKRIKKEADLFRDLIFLW